MIITNEKIEEAIKVIDSSHQASMSKIASINNMHIQLPSRQELHRINIKEALLMLRIPLDRNKAGTEDVQDWKKYVREIAKQEMDKQQNELLKRKEEL